MRRLPVLVLGFPRLLRDIVRHVVSEQPDMAVASEQVVHPEPLSLAQRDDVGVVVLLLGECSRAAAEERLRAVVPPRAVIAVYAGGYRATLYRSVLQPAADLPPESSIEALLGAIRVGAEAPPR